MPCDERRAPFGDRRAGCVADACACLTLGVKERVRIRGDGGGEVAGERPLDEIIIEARELSLIGKGLLFSTVVLEATDAARLLSCEMSASSSGDEVDSSASGEK